MDMDMEGNHRFFKCDICGNLSGLILNMGAPLVCCGQEMTELIPNTTEAATEKHLPAVSSEIATCECGCECVCLSIQVGSVPHPMEEAHHITFVYVETEQGGQRKCLNIGDEPKVDFCVRNDKPVGVYAYCNLHGLWETAL